MSSTDSDADRADELTERYRVASAADPARPNDSVRESVLAYARTVADQAPRGISLARLRGPAANDSSWRLSAAASVIVAFFAALLAWHFHAPVRDAGPNPAAAQDTASNQPATESAASGRPSEPLPTDHGASVAPAPNAVAARSRARVDAAAEARRPEHDADAKRSMEGARVSSAQQAPARVAGASAAENATNVQARRFQGQEAAARADIAASSPLVSAAEAGNLERVDQLLRGGMSTEQSDARGRTALLVATLRGDLPIVRRLLAAGARTDAVAEGGDTPLAAARRQGQPELVSLLEQAAHPQN